MSSLASSFAPAYNHSVCPLMLYSSTYMAFLHAIRAHFFAVSLQTIPRTPLTFAAMTSGMTLPQTHWNMLTVLPSSISRVHDLELFRKALQDRPFARLDWLPAEAV